MLWSSPAAELILAPAVELAVELALASAVNLASCGDRQRWRSPAVEAVELARCGARLGSSCGARLNGAPR